MGNFGIKGGSGGLIPDSDAGSSGTPDAPSRKSFWAKRKTGVLSATPATPVATPKNPTKALFGVTFKTSLERSPDYNTSEQSKLIPIVVRKCCEFLNAKGLEEEGVYRIPGNRKNIDNFIDKFNSGQVFDFLEESNSRYIDPNDVAGVLLQFNKSLTDSLFTDDLHQHFLGVSWKDLTPDQKVKKLKELMAILPDANRETIRFLMYHFYLVKSGAKKNHMHTKNLVLCVYGTSPYSAVYFNLIEHYNAVFVNNDEAPVQNQQIPPPPQETPPSSKTPLLAPKTPTSEAVPPPPPETPPPPREVPLQQFLLKQDEIITIQQQQQSVLVEPQTPPPPPAEAPPQQVEEQKTIPPPQQEEQQEDQKQEEQKQNQEQQQESAPAAPVQEPAKEESVAEEVAETKPQTSNNEETVQNEQVEQQQIVNNVEIAAQ